MFVCLSLVNLVCFGRMILHLFRCLFVVGFFFVWLSCCLCVFIVFAPGILFVFFGMTCVFVMSLLFVSSTCCFALYFVSYE